MSEMALVPSSLGSVDKTWKVIALGAGGLCACVWIRWRNQPWAPLSAEWQILRTLFRDGVLRIFYPSADDGSVALSFRDRIRRVYDLRNVLGLERFHQIDVARRKALGIDGWGKTTGTGHMQHLPTLVFKGEDQVIAKKTLERSAALLANPSAGLKLHQEWEQTPVLKDLVLVGGGHSHVTLLRMLGMEPLPGIRVTLISRDVEAPYSGMIPGHVAGLYSRRECHLDLNMLARFARVRFVHATVVGLDLDKKHVLLDGDRPPIAYDTLSINIGSAPKVQDDFSANSVTPVKPIDGFGVRWDGLLKGIGSWGSERRLLVVGGGAGGFELAMTMHARLTNELAKMSSTTKLKLALVTRSGLLPQHTPGARALARKVLRERGIEVLAGYSASRAESGTLHCDDGRTLEYDDCIWCTQGSAQPWVSTCGLQTDKNGFLLVDQKMRCRPSGLSIGHDIGTIFAGGDVASIDGHDRAKSGVFAVMGGFVLWINIRATLLGEPLVTYWPQTSFLGLFGLGDGNCIASRGALAVEGAWLWELKDWIDRRWMWNYQEGGLPEMPANSHNVSVAGNAIASAAGDGALSVLKHAVMRCGGCGAKVGATTLSQAMGRVQIPSQPSASANAKVVVGVGDDAAVVELTAEGGSGHVSSVQTIDFFRSFIDDPYLFGRIATIHALSDCEAMGAVPQTALALVQVPYAVEAKQEEDLVQLMSGAASALRDVGCALVGGHTCEARELGLGFSVTGRLPGGSDAALTKAALKPDDVLIITKPVGTGALFAADMRAKARGPWVIAALRSMATSNSKAAEVLRDHGAKACTDVTGFGLIGHLLEMCKSSGARATIDLPKVPLYDGALECIQMGIASSLQPANTRLRRAVSNHEEVRGLERYPLLFDPQTSGGLLAAVPGAKAEQCVQVLRSTGIAPSAAIIGKVDGPAPTDLVERLRIKSD